MIVLLGYMGSGKSAVSQCYGANQGKRAVDLDDYIESIEGMSITDLFDEKGAIYFRKAERKALELAIKDATIDILSLGGGAPCYYDNMKLLEETPFVTTIYLHTSIPILVERLFTHRSNRPLIAATTTKDELAEFIGKHLFERSFYYNQAQHTIKTDGKTPREIVLEINGLQLR